MEELYISNAAILSEAGFLDNKELIGRRKYRYWIDESVTILETTQYLLTLPPDTINEVVPVLVFDIVSDKKYVTDSDKFKSGTIFEVNGLYFQVLDLYTAICLTSIGTSCYDTNGNRDYNKSELKAVIDDWFNNYISDITVDERNIFIEPT